MRHSALQYAIVALALTLGGCPWWFETKPSVHGTADLGDEPVDLREPRDFTYAAIGSAGDPCESLFQCAKGTFADQPAQCLLSDAFDDGREFRWPGGACTSRCRMDKNDPNHGGINSDCPGGHATCQSDGSPPNGRCVAVCNSSQECRNGGTDYSCFRLNDQARGCLPTAISECDPKVPGRCPAQNGLSRACSDAGDGTVGLCAPSCDPFANTGSPATGDSVDCHISEWTGEAFCAAPCTTAVCQNSSTNAGIACGGFYGDCPGGYGCLAGQCWKYCNTANLASQCSFGATCEKLTTSTTVPTSVAGICSHSS